MTEKNHKKGAALQVTLTHDSLSFEGSLRDATDPTVHVTFAHGAAPFIPLNETVHLRFSGEALPESLEVKASPTSWHSSEEGDRVFFELDEADRVALRSSIHSHRSVRVPLRGKQAVRVRLETLRGGLAIDSALIDISESGSGLILSEKSDRLLCGAMLSASGEEHEWYLKLTFRLPVVEEDCTVVGEIRYRRLSRGCIKYGIRFDEAKTSELCPAHELSTSDLVAAYQEGLSKAA